MTGWRVVRTLAGVEFYLTDNILSAGFEATCPSYVLRRRNRYGNRGETTAAVRPLFPSYVFLRHRHDFRREYFETGRVKLTVMRGCVLSDDAIAAFVETAELASRACLPSPLEVGESVKILHGALRGDSATILRVRGSKLVVDVVHGVSRRVVTVDSSEVSRVAIQGT